MVFKRCFGCMRELLAPGAVCPHCGFDNMNDPGKQPDHVLRCGTVLNSQYVVGRSLGQGGFGITYIGWDLSLDTPVCIKEYYPEGAAMRSAVQSRAVYWGNSENARGMKQGRDSFVKEARKAVKLRDLSHVVSVWGVFYENETAYIVMDYIEGETLKSRLRRTQKALGERECAELLAPVIRDLEKAHNRGIVHRDIKPDNLMLNMEGELVLLDMGAAKDLSGGSGQSSYLVASQGFSPMEQYRAHGEIGPWTDVYAMCATIYYCVTGRLLPAPMDRLAGESVNLAAFSPAFAAVLEKGFAIRPEDRFQTMGALREALEEALDAGNRQEEKAERERREKAEREQRESAERERREREAQAQREKAEQERRAPKPRKKSPVPLIAAVLLVLAAVAVFTFKGGIGGDGVVTAPPTPAPSTPAPTTPAPPTPAPTTPAPSTPAPSTPTPIPTPSGNPLSTGTTADGLTYEVFADCVRISDCDNSVTKIVIHAEIEGKPVTSIGHGAFIDCTALTSIAIPDSVTSIGNSAFKNCISLTSVTIPDSMTDIGFSAFCNCSSLRSITVPNGVTSIGGSAFLGCNALTDITIPDGVTSIENGVFSDCGSLTNVTIPEGVTSIGNSSFKNCNALRSITIPDSVTSIGQEAFENCVSLTSIMIPGGAISIGNYAFENCSALTSVTIPNGVTWIGHGMFRGCESLTNITIPDSIIGVGWAAFEGCTALTIINYSGTEAQWKKISIGDFNDSLTHMTIRYDVEPGPTPTTTPVPGGDPLFTGTTEDGLNYKVFDDYVRLMGCDQSVTEVVIPAEIEGKPVTEIGDNAFSYCDSLTSVTIPDSVFSVGSCAFKRCGSLTSVTIPGSVTSIGDWAFFICTSLSSVTISDSVTSIGKDAFGGCKALTVVYYSGTKEQWKNISINIGNTWLTHATIHYNAA